MTQATIAQAAKGMTNRQMNGRLRLSPLAAAANGRLRLSPLAAAAMVLRDGLGLLSRRRSPEGPSLLVPVGRPWVLDVLDVIVGELSAGEGIRRPNDVSASCCGRLVVMVPTHASDAAVFPHECIGGFLGSNHRFSSVWLRISRLHCLATCASAAATRSGSQRSSLRSSLAGGPA